MKALSIATTAEPAAAQRVAAWREPVQGARRVKAAAALRQVQEARGQRRVRAALGRQEVEAGRRAPAERATRGRAVRAAGEVEEDRRVPGELAMLVPTTQAQAGTPGKATADEMDRAGPQAPTAVSTAQM